MAGEGSRLRSLTRGSPKCLVEVEGRPLLHHLLDRLEAVCDGVCLVVPPDAVAIEDALTRHPFGRAARTVVQEIPKGLRDAVSRAVPMVTDRALVVMGDTFFTRSLEGALGDLGPDEGGLLVEPDGPEPDEPAGWAAPGQEGYASRVWKGSRGLEVARRVAGGFVLERIALERVEVSPSGVGFETVIDESIRAGARYRLLQVEGPRWNVNTPGQLAALRDWLEEHAHEDPQPARS